MSKQTDYAGPCKGIVLPQDHHLVYMTYGLIPSFDDLERDYGKGYVSPVFDGRSWDLHPSCIDMDRTSGDRIVYVHNVYRESMYEGEEMIAWGLAQRSDVALNGYRPMTHDEGYAVSKIRPDLMDYVLLGSSTRSDSNRFVATMWSEKGWCGISTQWIGHRFDPRERILFVCK